MKNIKTLIASSLLLATTASFAATDTTNIEINVTKDAFVNLVGSAVGSSHALNTADLGSALSLGTLGTESNAAGDCDVTVTTANNFELLNTGGDTLGVYTVNYASTALTAGSTPVITQSCNTAASDLTFTNPAVPANAAAGVYSDVITVTVVTQ